MAAFVWGHVCRLFLTYPTATFVHVDAECSTQPLGVMMIRSGQDEEDYQNERGVHLLYSPCKNQDD
jgi:hypothetical protein